MVARLRGGLGRESKYIPLKSTISSLLESSSKSSSNLILLLLLVLIRTCCCCCSYIIFTHTHDSLSSLYIYNIYTYSNIYMHRYINEIKRGRFRVCRFMKISEELIVLICTEREGGRERGRKKKLETKKEGEGVRRVTRNEKVQNPYIANWRYLKKSTPSVTCAGRHLRSTAFFFPFSLSISISI